LVKDLFTNEGALIKYWQQNVFNDLFFCCLICVLMQFKEIINFASYYYCYYLKKIMPTEVCRTSDNCTAQRCRRDTPAMWPTAGVSSVFW